MDGVLKKIPKSLRIAISSVGFVKESKEKDNRESWYDWGEYYGFSSIVVPYINIERERNLYAWNFDVY